MGGRTSRQQVLITSTESRRLLRKRTSERELSIVLFLFHTENLYNPKRIGGINKTFAPTKPDGILYSSEKGVFVERRPKARIN